MILEAFWIPYCIGTVCEKSQNVAGHPKMKTLTNGVVPSCQFVGNWGVLRQIEIFLSCGCCLVLGEMQRRAARKEVRRKHNGYSGPDFAALSPTSIIN